MFELLFKYPAEAFARGQLELAAPGWVAALAVAAAFAAAYALLARRRLARGPRLALAAARGGAFALLALALCQPTLVVSTPAPERATVAVLVDDSRSMTIADHDGGPRAEFVRAAFGAADASLRAALAARFDTRVFRFAADAAPLDDAGLAFAGTRIDLARALESVRRRLAGSALAAVVVVSDGALSDAGGLDAALAGLRTAGVAVHTVGVGAERYARDLEVAAVNVARRPLAGAGVDVDVVVAQRGFEAEPLVVTVEDEGRVVALEELTPPPGRAAHTLRARFVAGEAGPRRLTVRVAAAGDAAAPAAETVAANNARTLLVDVRPGPQRILYFEGEPRFELKFARRAVADDPAVHVVALVRTAESKYYRVGVDGPEELAEGFPQSAEALFAYRGLVLGSVDASHFSPAQLELIAEFVGRRGGGLLLLGGRRAFAAGGYAATPLDPLVPVVLDAAPGPSFRASVTVRPTLAGRSHPLTRLEPRAGGGDPWAGLPPLTVLHPLVRARPGAAVLLEGEAAGGPAPLAVLAQQRYGRGHVIALNVQDSWRWQMHQDVAPDDATHETLWRALLRALVRSAPDAVSLRVGADDALPGDAVAVAAEVRDAAFEARTDAAVALRVLSPLGDETLVAMAPGDAAGAYAATLAPAHAGLYELALVDANAPAGEPLAASHLLVGGAERELFGAEMDAALLARIAADTGRRFYRAGEAQALADALPATRAEGVVVERLALWNLPAVFLALLALLGFEWVYRRRRGLP